MSCLVGSPDDLLFRNHELYFLRKTCALNQSTPVTGSEDFAYYLEKKPGCFLRLGNGDGAMLHNPKYDFNDAILTVGAAYWTRLAERFLSD